MKKIFTSFVDYLVKHSKVVCSVSITSIVFMALIFWMQLDFTKDANKIIKQNIALNNEIVLYHELSERQNEDLRESIGIINTQNKFMETVNEHFRKQSEVIEDQNKIIQKLIERLQQLDEWPPSKWPSPDRYDPDKIAKTESQSNEQKKNIKEIRCKREVVDWY
jgi:predicted PurR-regulated permease PerM